MKHLLMLVGVLYGFCRQTRSSFHSRKSARLRPLSWWPFLRTHIGSGQRSGTEVLNTNQVDDEQSVVVDAQRPPVTAVNRFVTEANAVDYHIYLQVPQLDQWNGLHVGDAVRQHELCL